MVSGSSTSSADFRGSALSFSLATIGDDVPLAGNGDVALLASGGVVPLTKEELFLPLVTKNDVVDVVEVVPLVNGGVVSFANGELAGKNHLVLSTKRTTLKSIETDVCFCLLVLYWKVPWQMNLYFLSQDLSHLVSNV